MPIIYSRPTRRSRNRQNYKPSRRQPVYVPPPVRPGQKPETLDRRIRNIESLDQGVFTGNVLASYMALPGLVGFWPMSSIQRSTGNVYDLSVQSRALTYNGNPAFTYFNGIVPYIDLDGTGDYLSRADETDLDITGTETIFTTGSRGLTMGGWFWADGVASNQGLIGKHSPTGNQRGYLLQVVSTGVLRATISSNGTAVNTVDSAAVSANTWYFVALRFTPSTELAIFVNSDKATNTTSIPASIFDNTAAFEIGAFDGASNLLTGQATLCFLSANALGDDLISSLYQTSRVLFSI